MRFIEQMLMNQQTRLKFYGFTSDWVGVDNGIIQGDPLSMILYLFYNADLIEGAKKGEAKIAYVNDTNYYTKGVDFEEAYEKLRDMMTRDGGGQDWSCWHNSKFEMSKLALMGFSRWQAPDPSHPGKLRPESRPNLELNGAVIKPAVSHKFLGVLFNQELRWNEQVEKVVAKPPSGHYVHDNWLVMPLGSHCVRCASYTKPW